jgi:DNA processing protein
VDNLPPNLIGNLLDLQDPPKKLYGRGSIEVLRRPSISVIGARRATPYGLAVAEMAGRIAAESDIVLVSGGARGCDSAAARAALDAGGKTVVVSGCGADLVYPKSSADVFSRAVSTGGAVISLDEWGTPPRRYAFPRRNRLIAALSEATMIVEAGLRSGTMSTASIAMDLGRRLYAVPGSIFAPESAGANRLIADGASIIASETDLEACITLDFDRMRLFEELPGRACGRLMSAIVASPMRPDELAHRMEESIIEVLRTLSDYEAKGWVTRLRDGRYAASKEFLKLRDRMEETDDDS